MRKQGKKVSLLTASVLTAALLATGCGSNAAVDNAAPADSTSPEKEETVTEETVTEETVTEATVTEEATAEVQTQQEPVAEETKTEEQNTEEAKTEEVTEGSSLFSEVSSEGFSLEGALKGQKSALPAYEYPGPEEFYHVLYKYIIEEYGVEYLQGDVCIPCPIIVAEDDSNKDDMLIWGDFSVYNYKLSGDTLMTISGGSHPGLIHYKLGESGYQITAFDQVEDGSNYDSSAKRIFGDKYDAFIKANGDSKAKDELRAQIISNYAAANNLNISGYQDYGWEKIALPNENIDSFYSTY